MNVSPPSKRVLICEDEEVTRMTLVRRIEKIGYQVVGEAVDGLDAMSKFRELKPDIVLLDINMPQASGLTVLSYIRDNSSLTRVVMITGSDLNRTSDTVIKALKAGANDYLTKGNFDEERFKKAVGYTAIESNYTEKDAISLIEELEQSQKEMKKSRNENDRDMMGADLEEPQKKDIKPTPIRRMARSTRFK